MSWQSSRRGQGQASGKHVLPFREGLFAALRSEFRLQESRLSIEGPRRATADTVQSTRGLGREGQGLGSPALVMLAYEIAHCSPAGRWPAWLPIPSSGHPSDCRTGRFSSWGIVVGQRKGFRGPGQPYHTTGHCLSRCCPCRRHDSLAAGWVGGGAQAIAVKPPRRRCGGLGWAVLLTSGRDKPFGTIQGEVRLAERSEREGGAGQGWPDAAAVVYGALLLMMSMDA